MERRIKILYIVSIIAILTFLAMQVYWLYARYEYFLNDYENRVEVSVEKALSEYDKARNKANAFAVDGDTIRVQSSFNMNHDVDSVGRPTREVSVRTSVINGRKLLGIKENRKLTSEEMIKLEKMVLENIEGLEERKATVDVTSAPSDGEAWTSMRNFELEFQSPFTVEGIDSILSKENFDTDISLVVTDTLAWKPAVIRHSSVFSPRVRIITHYSELERKAVVIDCKIPMSEAVRDMGWTLDMAFLISLFLIFCLVWQIKTIAKLTRLDKMRNSFVTTMIHELKRPISTLKMCVSGVENEKMMASPEVRAELTTSAREALDNLSAYFSRLRDITFNDVEQIPLNLSQVNLRELFDESAGKVQIPQEKDATFVNRIPAELDVEADRTHLSNIFVNLLENAVKYSGASVVVEATAEAADGIVSVSVADNGQGIAPEDLRHVFSRFYRGNASLGVQPGMGLGLTYVKLLTEAHGGTVTVESTPGEGSRFTITLPQ